MLFWGAIPRVPNFAKIYARGGRGLLQTAPWDLIPPWGHRLLHGEAEKPTMPVWLDRYGGALPSRRTGLVGKDNGRQATPQPVRNGSNQAVLLSLTRHMTTGGRHRHTEQPCAPGIQGTNAYLVTGLPGDTSSKPGFHPGRSGQKTGCTQAQWSVFAGTWAAFVGIAEA